MGIKECKRNRMREHATLAPTWTFRNLSSDVGARGWTAWRREGDVTRSTGGLYTSGYAAHAGMRYGVAGRPDVIPGCLFARREEPKGSEPDCST